MAEIKETLENVGFDDIQTKGHADPHRLAFFGNLKAHNFHYVGYKLNMEAPSDVISSPFLVRVGKRWTKQGLFDLLKNYLGFRLAYFGQNYFPKTEDFLFPAIYDKVLCEKVFRIEETLRNCHQGKKSEIEKITEIKNQLKEKSAGEIKREIFYLYIQEKRLKVPWGGLPTGKLNQNLLIDWLAFANKVFPFNQSNDTQLAKDLFKLKRLKDAQNKKLTA